MSFEAIKIAIEDFKSKKIYWITLAKILAEARDQGELDSDRVEEECKFAKFKIARFITAYRFLEIRRPDILELPPEQVIADPRAVSDLPNLYSRLPEETREVQITELLDKVIKKQIFAHEIEDLSVSLSKNTGKLLTQPRKRELPTIPLEEEEMKLFGKHMDVFKEMINLCIKKHGYDTLNKYYAGICDEVAILLNCIADSEFRKSWEERKEIQL